MKTWNSDTLFSKLDKLLDLLSPVKQAIKLCDHDIACTSKVYNAIRAIRASVAAWAGPVAVKALVGEIVEDRVEYLFFSVHAGPAYMQVFPIAHEAQCSQMCRFSCPRSSVSDREHLV